MKLKFRLPQLISTGGKQNENLDYVYPDAANISPDSKLFIICDGLGPYRNGNNVAEITGKLFYDYFTRIAPPKQRVGQIYMNDALRYAERKLWQHVQENPLKQGMGSSLMLLYVNDDGSISIAWVGNIRAYHVRDKQIIYETEDHLTILRENGRNISVEPRVISGSEPVWVSVTVISDIQSDDYFLLCTQGIYETFDHRNIKYLLSQGDGTDTTNRAIVAKMQELCTQNWDDDFSLLLIPVQEGTTVSKATGLPKAAANTGEIVPPKTAQLDNLPSGIVKRKERKPETTSRKPLFSGGSNMNMPSPARAGIISLLVLLAITAAFAYQFLISKPEDVFKRCLNKATEYMAAGDFENAVKQFESALEVKLPDTSAFTGVREQLAQARYSWLSKQAENFFNTQNWVKARIKYEELLALNPADTLVKQQVDVLNQTIVAEKTKLLAKADTLLGMKDYANAKQLLYEALYFDQTNDQILQQINQCNQYLNLQQLSLADAVQLVTRMDSLGEFKTNRLAVVTTSHTDTTGVLSDGDIFEQEPNPDNIYTDQLPVTTTTTTTLNDKYTNLVKQGDDAMKAGDFETAKSRYTEALSYNRNTTLEEKINASEQAILEKKYNDVIALADQAFNGANYENARNYYLEALKYKINDEYAGSRAEECQDKLTKAITAKATNQAKTERYDKLIAEAEAAYAAEDFATAKGKYKEALQVSPAEAARINTKIAECDSKITNLQSESSSKKLKKAEKICKSANYGEACYDYLKSNNLLYSVDAQILLQVSKYFETKDPAKAKECANIANNR
ncbi:tetratricopeptide repeat protein [Sphingobacteriales bacterium UPWRP_1]|nr:hypothetical protein BVG80_03650 [Sphingobacteriales bacterium TSM_CSM]PSJ75689.1 tetratricopeptide repeat protein [Sphingobacteriales bacterium UPWRP_1]